MKTKAACESEAAQPCLSLHDPMNYTAHGALLSPAINCRENSCSACWRRAERPLSISSGKKTSEVQPPQLRQEFSLSHSAPSLSELFTNKRMISGSSFLPSLSTLWRQCRPKKMTKRIETERKGKSLDKTYEGTDQSSDSMKRHSFTHATSTPSLSNHPVQVSVIQAVENQPADSTPSHALCISRSEGLETEGELSWWDQREQRQLRSKGGSSRFPELSYLTDEMCPHSTKELQRNISFKCLIATWFCGNAYLFEFYIGKCSFEMQSKLFKKHLYTY